jgi:hypothetical protein
LLIVPQHLPPLQKKAKQDSGNQTVKKLIRSFFTSLVQEIGAHHPADEKAKQRDEPAHRQLSKTAQPVARRSAASQACSKHGHQATEKCNDCPAGNTRAEAVLPHVRNRL